MMLKQSGRIPFEYVEDIMPHVDKKLAKKVSRADYAKSIRSRALRNFRIKSVREKRKDHKEKQKQG